MRQTAGIHVQSWTDAMKDLVRRQPVGGVKMLQGCVSPEMCRWVLARNADAWFVCRHAYPALTSAVTDAEWLARCDQTLNEASPLRFLGNALLVELPSNEDLQGGADPNSDELRRLNDLTVRGAERYRSYGVRPIGFNFSVGNPVRVVGAAIGGAAVVRGTEHARLIVEGVAALIAAGGAVGVHEYSWPGLPDDGWRMERYTRLATDLRRLGLDPDWFVGECGYDRGANWGQPIGGYRLLDDTPERGRDYGAFLDQHAKRYALNPKLVGAAVFGGGAFDDFASFRYDGDDPVTAPMAKQYPLAEVRTWTPPQPKEPLVIRGIDVSNNQGPAIDWAQVAASGVVFAAIKASGDETASGRFVDPYFVRNWHAAGQREIVRIAYHYGCPSQVSAAQSVALFAEQIAAAGGIQSGDLVALDLEDPAVPVGTTLVSWTADWLTRVEATFGVVPMLYTGNYYLVEHGMLADGGLGQTVRLGRYPLWLASYQPTKPPPPAGWDHITIWQHASDGRVPGIAGDCDLNQFEGTTADLRALGLPDPSAPRTKESSVIQLNDADKAAIQAANDATWAAAETYQRVLAGYGARGASLGEWNSQIAKGAVVNIKAACGLQAA